MVIDYVELNKLRDGDYSFFFGKKVYLCDKVGIEAADIKELLGKINWCESVGIYTEGCPINGHTLHAVYSELLFKRYK